MTSAYRQTSVKFWDVRDYSPLVREGEAMT